MEKQQMARPKMWNRELVEVLISKYQEHENLYNVRHPAYLDKGKRSNSLFDIYKKLKEKNGNASVEDIKNKIHSLRTQYIKELREIANNKRNGIGIDEDCGPRLWCFSQLDFLKSHCATRKSKSNNSEMDNIESVIVVKDEPIEIDDEPQLKPHGNKRKNASKRDERLDSAKRMLVNGLEEKANYDWLGQQVVFQMNEIKDKKIQRDTAWKIQQILREASQQDEEFGYITDSSEYDSRLFLVHE